MVSAYSHLKNFYSESDILFMWNELDLYFPYIVLCYGIIMTLVTQMPHLMEKAQESMNQELIQWFYGHRVIGSVCLYVGGLWSLQRLFV